MGTGCRHGKIMYIAFCCGNMQVLSVQQLYKICTQYWDDKYNTESVSEEVLDEMRTLITKESGQDSSENTFLLDDEIR